MFPNILENFIGQIMFFDTPFYFYERQFFQWIRNLNNSCDFSDVGRFEGNIVYLNVIIAFIGDPFIFNCIVLAMYISKLHGGIVVD
jgi:hypothetical protein